MWMATAMATMRLSSAIKLVAVVAILAAVATRTTAAVATRSADADAVWELENLRRSACAAMEAIAASECRDGSELLGCCSTVAAYEATACACALRGGGSDVVAQRAEPPSFDLEDSARRCQLTELGLGVADEECTPSRLAAINFPFLVDLAGAAGREQESERILDAWIAEQAFLLYESVDEQRAGLGKALPRSEERSYFPLCAQLALRAASECAPTWSPRGGKAHALACCDAIHRMNRDGVSCFCDEEVVGGLGGREALSELASVASDACGLRVRMGESCK